MFDENREACDRPINCQVNNTVKTQKSMKDIDRIFHQWFNLNFLIQKYSNTVNYYNLNLNIYSIWTFWSDKNKFCTQRKYKLQLYSTIRRQNGTILTLRRIVVIFIFFAYKNYSCRFIKFRLNKYSDLNCNNNNSQYYCYCGFAQINAASVGIRDLRDKNKSYWPQTSERWCSLFPKIWLLDKIDSHVHMYAC